MLDEIELKSGEVKISISCTWGDGPDVLFATHCPRVSTQGYVPGFFPLDFTGDEAIQIGKMLIHSGNQAKEMDVHLEQYIQSQKGG